jgi:hypothetical protein
MTSLFKTLGEMFNPNVNTLTEEQHRISQNKRILKDLLKGDKLTPFSMLNRYGSLRAGARIFDLRRQGWNIITTMITTKSGKHIAEYSLEKHEI